MLKRTITYTDFNGTSRTEDFYFHLSKTELMELAMDLPDGLIDSVAAKEERTDMEMASLMIAALGGKGITKFIKTLILDSYGVKSLDGRRFEKIDQNGRRLADDFAQTPAFEQLYFEMITDDAKASAFMAEIIPQSILKDMDKSMPMPAVLPAAN